MCEQGFDTGRENWQEQVRRAIASRHVIRLRGEFVDHVIHYFPHPKLEEHGALRKFGQEIKKDATTRATCVPTKIAILVKNIAVHPQLG